MSSNVELLRANVTPFSPIQEDGDAITQHFDSFSDCKILLIDDGSHGTSEFYAARAEITKYMIEHHTFNIVAVEADWPDAETVDRCVRDFVEWPRKYNKGRGSEATGFYGLDLYSMSTSMREVIQYLEKVDPDAADVARERYGKLIPCADDPHEYGLEALMTGFKGYEGDVIAMLKDLLGKRLEYSAALWNGTEFYSGEQNARVVADTHMFETLVRILKHRGDSSKAIVWAHNSHVGDARATSMGWSRDELNLGHLCKEMFGNRALNIGCGTNTGTVAAAKRWDSDMSVMKLNPGLPNSYEDLMHATGVKNFMLDRREGKGDERLRQLLCKKRLERFIGVIYRPDTEKQSHCSSAILPDRWLVTYEASLLTALSMPHTLDAFSG
ncbi:hypothetical protein QQX98_009808 [Neonectria punicea]|uniref:Erythromycin esterase n=1 Tax=Neonectria punicea TaxID=979145 RepID=A0ABR1GRD7_9HYPO